ncbi:MAG: hypothetical protein ACTSRU_10495, partial [Candidatus Hodarchaeales archaeon]
MRKARELGVVNPAEVCYDIGKKSGISSRMPRYIPEGRLESNLRISTCLFKISYLKHALPPHLSYMNEFRRAAIFIENYNEDIGKLNYKELNSLPFTEDILKIVIEMRETGENGFLQSKGEFSNLFY